MSTRRQLTGWVVWCVLLALVTMVLLESRDVIDEAHVSLTMLLVVLGGSIAGGRALGFTLAGA